MIGRANLFRRLVADRGGVSAVEFALVAPVLALTIVGLFDIGYGMYVNSVLQGALHDAARLSTVGTLTTAQISARVSDQLATVSRQGTVEVTTNSYPTFNDLKMPEKITSDTVPMGQYNVGDCYDDTNGNQQWDADRGKAGMGQADDIVEYKVKITYPRMLPMPSMLGWSQNMVITSSTPLRNQPYAARAHSVINRCT